MRHGNTSAVSSGWVPDLACPATAARATTATMRTFDEMLKSGLGVERRAIELLPEPKPRERKYLIFSVDDHVCESRDTFTARVPAKYGDTTSTPFKEIDVRAGAPQALDFDVGTATANTHRP